MQKRFGRQGIPLLQKVQKALIHHQHGPAVRTAAHQALHQLRRGNLPGGVVGLAQKHQVNALVHCLHKSFGYGKIIGLMQGFPLYFAANAFQCGGILGKGGGRAAGRGGA